MKNQIGATLAIGLLLNIVPTVTAQANPAQIAVGVVNKAQMDPRALNEALKLAAMVLGWTGVELMVADCSVERSEPAPPCTGFTGTSQISVRLIRRHRKVSGEAGFQKLGMADPLEKRPGSGSVYVFCEMVEIVVKDRRVPLQDVLGVVIA